MASQKKDLLYWVGKLEEPLCIQQYAAVASVDNSTDAFRQKSTEGRVGQSCSVTSPKAVFDFTYGVNRNEEKGLLSCAYSGF